MNAGGRDCGCDGCAEMWLMRLAFSWAAAVAVAVIGESAFRGNAFPTTDVGDEGWDDEFEFNVYIVLRGIS